MEPYDKNSDKVNDKKQENAKKDLLRKSRKKVVSAIARTVSSIGSAIVTFFSALVPYLIPIVAGAVLFIGARFMGFRCNRF